LFLVVHVHFILGLSIAPFVVFELVLCTQTYYGGYVLAHAEVRPRTGFNYAPILAAQTAIVIHQTNYLLISSI